MSETMLQQAFFDFLTILAWTCVGIYGVWEIFSVERGYFKRWSNMGTGTRAWHWTEKVCCALCLLALLQLTAILAISYMWFTR
ncbi:hypothetical protein [Vibrio phage vB_VpS_PG28]|nr:hypothetical protein [Vibrio phage vB_VpS_PG28]